MTWKHRFYHNALQWKCSAYLAVVLFYKWKGYTMSAKKVIGTFGVHQW